MSSSRVGAKRRIEGRAPLPVTPGLSGVTASVLFDGSERFALIDGPELDHGAVPQLPADGTATYAGPAGGLYSYVAGTDWGANAGAFVIDEYQGTVTLTADFADGTLKGCVGCVGDLVTQRAHFGVFLGEQLIDVQAVAADYELHLAAAIIREDGIFERDRVTVRHPGRTIALPRGIGAGPCPAARTRTATPGWWRASAAPISRRATAARASSSGRSWG